MIKIKSLFYAGFLAPFLAAAQEAEVTTAPVALLRPVHCLDDYSHCLGPFHDPAGPALFYGGRSLQERYFGSDALLHNCLFGIGALGAGLYNLAFAEGSFWLGELSNLDSKEWKLLVCQVAYRRRCLSCQLFRDHYARSYCGCLCRAYEVQRYFAIRLSGWFLLPGDHGFGVVVGSWKWAYLIWPEELWFMLQRVFQHSC